MKRYDGTGTMQVGKGQNSFSSRTASVMLAVSDVLSNGNYWRPLLLIMELGERTTEETTFQLCVVVPL